MVRRRPMAVPQRQIQPVRRAGTPETTACGGTSRVTTAPAATKAYAPIVTPQTIVALAPIVAPRPTGVGSKLALPIDGRARVAHVGEHRRRSDEHVVVERRRRRRSRRCSGCGSRRRRPRVAATKTFWPRTQRAPIRAPAMTWQKCQILRAGADARARDRRPRSGAPSTRRAASHATATRRAAGAHRALARLQHAHDGQRVRAVARRRRRRARRRPTKWRHCASSASTTSDRARALDRARRRGVPGS